MQPPGLKHLASKIKKEQHRKQILTAVPPPDTATQIPLVSFNHSCVPTVPAFCHYRARREYLARSSAISLVLSLPNSFSLPPPPPPRLLHPLVSLQLDGLVHLPPFFIHHLQTSVYQGSLQGGDAATGHGCLLHFGLACACVCVCQSAHPCACVCVCALEKGNVCLSSPYTRNPGQCDVELNKKLHE